jgi:hypothetical protein
VTDAFSLETDDRNKPLDISYMGYKKTESEIGKKSDLSALIIKMYPDGIMLKGTVVTALGIKRKTKSLGYSVANIDGDVITENLSGNWLNALNGKSRRTGDASDRQWSHLFRESYLAGRPFFKLWE